MMALIEQAKGQILLLPDLVQWWMRWLNVVFLLSVFFVWGHKPARWALAAYVACFPVLVPFFIL